MGYSNKKAAIYADKDKEYFRRSREDLVNDWLSPDFQRILDVGCGAGATAKMLKDTCPDRHLCGIEIDEEAARIAREYFDDLVVGDLDEIELPWADGSFDAVIAGDVLEHLVDPWKAVSKIRGLLRPGGLFLGSTPNVLYWRIVSNLVLHGRFDYEENGPMDRGHLRFFTRRSLQTLISSAGLQLVSLDGGIPTFKQLLLRGITFGLARDFLIYRWYIVARRPEAGVDE